MTKGKKTITLTIAFFFVVLTIALVHDFKSNTHLTETFLNSGTAMTQSVWDVGVGGVR